MAEFVYLPKINTPQGVIQQLRGQEGGEGAQQVEVLPSLVTDCKKPLHQSRLFWGSGIGYFQVPRELKGKFPEIRRRSGTFTVAKIE